MISDARTGELKEAEILIAVLEASNYSDVKGTRSKNRNNNRKEAVASRQVV
jgi:hypothetical protein